MKPAGDDRRDRHEAAEGEAEGKGDPKVAKAPTDRKKRTPTAKRTARAAVRVAVDMVREGVLTKKDALLRVDARSLEQLLQARLPAQREPVVEWEKLTGGRR